VNLGHLLNPVQERIQSFQSKVEEVYVNEAKDRSALAEQVKMLTQLNNTLSLDTQNLTLALKGDRKAQGNWGEIILDEVLEKAGLQRGRHYDRQTSVKSEDGQTHVIPDVVIRLPGDGERHLVVDSKMTLPDYRAFADADTDEERQAALRKHLTSMRAHMKGLSEKNYQTLYGLKSLDFVVMFVPLEPAFMLAVTNDRELFQQAWEKNILLVSPSTLLFVVRTVAYLWRQEDLSRNAKEISSRGAELYDKLVGFVHDLQRVGEKIQQAQDSYVEARKKFSEGGGNLIGQAEKLRRLGVKPSKKLPAAWTDNAEDGAAVIEDGSESVDDAEPLSHGDSLRS
jgi:DNA recombination protein RmuC